MFCSIIWETGLILFRRWIDAFWKIVDNGHTLAVAVWSQTAGCKMSLQSWTYQHALVTASTHRLGGWHLAGMGHKPRVWQTLFRRRGRSVAKKFRGFCEVFSLPQTIFWTSGVPWKPVRILSGLTLGKRITSPWSFACKVIAVTGCFLGHMGIFFLSVELVTFLEIWLGAWLLQLGAWQGLQH